MSSAFGKTASCGLRVRTLLKRCTLFPQNALFKTANFGNTFGKESVLKFDYSSAGVLTLATLVLQL